MHDVPFDIKCFLREYGINEGIIKIKKEKHGENSVCWTLHDAFARHIIQD